MMISFIFILLFIYTFIHCYDLSEEQSTCTLNQHGELDGESFCSPLGAQVLLKAHQKTYCPKNEIPYHVDSHPSMIACGVCIPGTYLDTNWICGDDGKPLDMRKSPVRGKRCYHSRYCADGLICHHGKCRICKLGSQNLSDGKFCEYDPYSPGDTYYANVRSLYSVVDSYELIMVLASLAVLSLLGIPLISGIACRVIICWVRISKVGKEDKRKKRFIPSYQPMRKILRAKDTFENTSDSEKEDDLFVNVESAIPSNMDESLDNREDNDSVDSQEETLAPGQKMIALFSFDAKEPDELSFKQNESLTFISTTSEPEWILCHNQDHQEGIVPVTYLSRES